MSADTTSDEAMKAPLALWKKLSGAHWEMLAVTAVLFLLVAVFVDLKPVVEENFFFASSCSGVGWRHVPERPRTVQITVSAINEVS